MTNLFFQGKIIRQFWGKLIRQSTRQSTYTNTCLQFVTWGGQFSSNLVTFFHYDLKE